MILTYTSLSHQTEIFDLSQADGLPVGGIALGRLAGLLHEGPTAWSARE